VALLTNLIRASSLPTKSLFSRDRLSLGDRASPARPSSTCSGPVSLLSNTKY
jgi:hypothetical protein